MRKGNHTILNKLKIKKNCQFIGGKKTRVTLESLLVRIYNELKGTQIFTRYFSTTFLNGIALRSTITINRNLSIDYPPITEYSYIENVIKFVRTDDLRNDKVATKTVKILISKLFQE